MKAGMCLPVAVGFCVDTLEAAGYEVYAVGGCVRDALLGLPPHDYDLCTNALPEEMARVFRGFTLVRSGEKHGTIGVVIEKEVIEITTFRTEGGYRDNRHPDWVRFVRCLREDLSRRDFTINAMAYNPKQGYIDLFGGQADLERGVLRAVGDPRQRFAEDSLRILRGVRFAVRFGLAPEADTLAAMEEQAPLMDNLARERVFDELCKLLPLISAEDLLRYARILAQVVPPLGPCIGFEQHNPHHMYDVFAHIAHVVEATPPYPAVRWAALLHDCGKPACFTRDERGVGHFYGHGDISARLADQLLLELKAPTALREQVVFLVGHHMQLLEPDKKLLRRRLAKYGPEATRNLLALQRADGIGTGTLGETDRSREISALIDEILAEQACLNLRGLEVSGRDLMEIGFAPGREMGACLQWLLEQVMDEALPNEKQALLAAAKAFK